MSLCSKYIMFYGGITPVYYVDMSKEYIAKHKGEPYQAHSFRQPFIRRFSLRSNPRLCKGCPPGSD